MSENSRPSRPRRWHKLDNTANLFPVISSKRISNVYRISFTLTEPVIPELLQQALETVLPWFAAMRVRLRRGLFWRYLEANTGVPVVHKEDNSPGRYIDPKQNKHFLFRVTYFKNRINIEVFHVLTDGSGGLAFLQALCSQYLLLAHPSAFSDEEKKHRWFSGHAADTEDSYAANYVPTRKANFNEGRAFNLKGERHFFDTLSVIHAHIELSGILDFCRTKNVSITQYLIACIGWAVYTQQLKCEVSKYPVNIFMPINLRNLFESNTSLNFFSNVFISLGFNKPNLTFDGLLENVKTQFNEKVNKESVQAKISYTVGNSSNIFMRIVPLPIKNIVLRAIYETSSKSSTLGFTNLGRIAMPVPFSPFITGASLMLTPTQTQPFKCTAGSYEDTLTFTMVSMLKSVSLQRAIIRRFSHDGLSVTIETNGVDYESL